MCKQKAFLQVFEKAMLERTIIEVIKAANDRAF